MAQAVGPWRRGPRGLRRADVRAATGAVVAAAGAAAAIHRRAPGVRLAVRVAGRARAHPADARRVRGAWSADGSLVRKFLRSLGGTGYWNINNTYYNGSGQHVPNSLGYSQYWADNTGVPASGAIGATTGGSTGTYNQTMRGVDWLIQMNWLDANSGGCVQHWP